MMTKKRARQCARHIFLDVETSVRSFAVRGRDRVKILDALDNMILDAAYEEEEKWMEAEQERKKHKKCKHAK